MNLVKIQIGDGSETSEEDQYKMVSSCSSVATDEYDEFMDLKRNSNQCFVDQKDDKYEQVSYS